MSLRAKLALVLGLLAALAATSVGWLSYDATRDRMLSEIDNTLHSANDIRGNRIPGDLPGVGPGVVPGVVTGGGLGGTVPAGNGNGNGDTPRPFGIEQFVTQVLGPDGRRVRGTVDVTLPISDEEVRIARLGVGQLLSTVTASDGHTYRVLTRADKGSTLQLGRDLSEMEHVLADLRGRILLVGAIAVGIASIAGWLFARGLTKSLRKLTSAAAEVSTTGRLDIDISTNGRDEVGRLGAAFSSMLGALSRSRVEQQRLVQDAGHELRTPLTSLRTNVDVLRRHTDLPAEMRARVLDDLDTEVAELSSLVEEVVAVGSGRTSDEPIRAMPLADAVEVAAERVGRRTGRVVDVRTDGGVVMAQRLLIERAITNLLDNAAKFDRTDLPIELSAVGGRVAVRDHGPGIDPADLGHVFDRFFRAVAARSQPGSGLGLSIVTEVAAAHGGTTFAENHPDGGAIVGFVLPLVSD
jgi:two-component system, OmpR family, sensor histidine kinase MprB